MISRRLGRDPSNEPQAELSRASWLDNVLQAVSLVDEDKKSSEPAGKVNPVDPDHPTTTIDRGDIRLVSQWKSCHAQACTPTSPFPPHGLLH